MDGLPDNAGILRAVAELTSAGFKGGVLSFDQILVRTSTRRITSSFRIFFNQLMAN